MAKTVTIKSAATAETSATAALVRIGELELARRRLEREHKEITALDPTRGDIAFGRGELTVKLAEAAAAVRAAADAIIDAE